MDLMSTRSLLFSREKYNLYYGREMTTMKKYIYVVIVKTTGCSGNIIHYSDIATANRELAIARADELNAQYQDDPDYLAYVEGPVEFVD